MLKQSELLRSQSTTGHSQKCPIRSVAMGTYSNSQTISSLISCYGNIRQLSDNVQSDHLLCVQCLVEIQHVPFTSDVKHLIATNASGTIIFSAGNWPSTVTANYSRLSITQPEHVAVAGHQTHGSQGLVVGLKPNKDHTRPWMDQY